MGKWKVVEFKSERFGHFVNRGDEHASLMICHAFNNAPVSVTVLDQIVREHNAAEQMAEALRRMLDQFQEEADDGYAGDREALEAAHAALRAYRGEEEPTPRGIRRRG